MKTKTSHTENTEGTKRANIFVCREPGKQKGFLCFLCASVRVFLLVLFILGLLIAQANAMNVSLAWDANTESDLAGYKVYYGYASGGPYNGTGASAGASPIVVPLSSLANPSLPEYAVNNLPNTTYYLVLTAYDSEGLESGHSNQVTVSPPVVQQCAYAYTPWGECQPDGTQSRSVVSATPAGCAGTPVLSQPCNYVPPVAFNTIPKTGWTLLGVDSEETVGEPGQATNAFDGSPLTIWHTKYSRTADQQPHYIQIDLGATYDIDGLRYLPRQNIEDGVPQLNGTITAWEFSTSVDASTWSVASSGTWQANQAEKMAMFPTVRGRWVMLKSTASANGPWTSAAEISLSGTRVPECVYTYAPWGECQPDGTQSRSILSSGPSGCIGDPILSQGCSYVPPGPPETPHNLIIRIEGSGTMTMPDGSSVPFTGAEIRLNP